MSDHKARPEWRAAFLNRTVTRRTLRDVAGHGANADAAKRRRDAGHASPALPIAAMLQLLPSA